MPPPRIFIQLMVDGGGRDVQEAGREGKRDINEKDGILLASSPRTKI